MQTWMADAWEQAENGMQFTFITTYHSDKGHDFSQLHYTKNASCVLSHWPIDQQSLLLFKQT